MFAAIPYFSIGVYDLALPGLGTIPIDPWATLVAIGFVVGLEVARHRGIKLGIEPRDIVDGAVFTVLSGFLFGHLVTVLAYHPERLAEDGIWSLIKVWEGFSSYGGFLGAVFGSVLFYKVIRKRDYWRHADVITFGFPFGWLLGRTGCAVVHDHVGKETEFFGAMDFDWSPWVDGDPCLWAHGIRHELGLYEALYMVPVAVLWFVLGRRDRVPGLFMGLFATLYAPVRFGLDFLRADDLKNSDPRYWGLTPGQYGSLILLLLGLAILATRDWKGFRPRPLDGSSAAAPADEEPTAEQDAEQ